MSPAELQAECVRISALFPDEKAEVRATVAVGNWQSIYVGVWPKGLGKDSKFFNGDTWQQMFADAEAYAVKYVASLPRVCTAADLGVSP